MPRARSSARNNSTASLNCISVSFEEKHAELTKEPGAGPEDPDEYKAENAFWVPPAARCTYLQNSAKQPTIRANLGGLGYGR